MASFVEQATLKVNDQSTAQINRINSALKQLRQTANSLKNVKINLDLKTGQIRMAVSQIKNLDRSLKQLRATAGGMRAVRMTVNSTGIQQAHGRLQALQRAAARPIVVQTRQAGGLPAHLPRGAGGGGGGRGVGFTGGFTRGLGVGSVIGSFGAVASAGYLAAAALRNVAENAAKRDRTNLQAAVAASEAQRKVFEERDKAAGGKVPGSLPMTQDEFRQFRTTLLGDVPGDSAARARGDRAADDAARARQADAYARKIVTDILPRVFAQNPKATREAALEGARTYAKTINVGSSEAFESGSERFSDDAMRVLKAQQMAQAADPTLSPDLMRTVAANLKSSVKTMSTEALAMAFYTAGDLGQRVGNEINQAIQGGSGAKDIKALNESLYKLGLTTEGTRVDKKKEGGKGKILAGSQEQAMDALIFRDPAKFFTEAYIPRVKPEMEKAAADRAAKAKKAGKTQEEIDRVSRIRPEDWTARINKDFPGLQQTAKNAIFRFVNEIEQTASTMAQAQTSLDQDVDKALSEAWTNAANKVVVAWTDAASTIGDKIAQGINLNAILTKVAEGIANNPGLTTGVAAAVGVAVTGAMATAFAAPIVGLNGAAAALTAAAVRLGAPNVPGVGTPSGTSAGGAAGGAAKAGGVGAAIRTVVSSPAVWGAAAAFGAAYAARQLIASTTDDPANYTRQMVETAKMQLEAAKRAAATEPDPTKKAEAQAQVAELTAQIAKLAEQLSYQEGEKDANWIQAAVDAAAKERPATADANFPAAGADTKLATLPEDVKSSLADASQNWANTVTAGNSAFQTTFGELPGKGAEAGTNLGSQAASTLLGSAGGIGNQIGNSAAAAIKAAVSNLNINVNANVTGAKNSTSDKGGTSPD